MSSKGARNINHLNLLLPALGKTSGRHIEHHLEAFNGCYEWSSSHPEILEVVEVAESGPDSCHSKATVRVKAEHEYSNTVWITARDKRSLRPYPDSGDVLKCESRVAEIKRIEILTKLRVIDVDNYEVFELIAYDKSGNSFTTLEGVRFEWAIEQQAALGSFVSFKDASIKTTRRRMQLEDDGFRSDMAVMTGIRPGTVTVTTTLNEKEMKVGVVQAAHQD